jgi:hypothetical protein
MIFVSICYFIGFAFSDGSNDGSNDGCPYIDKCGLAQNYDCDNFCKTEKCKQGEMIRVYNAKCTYSGCRDTFEWEKTNFDIDVAVKYHRFNIRNFDKCILRADKALTTITTTNDKQTSVEKDQKVKHLTKPHKTYADCQKDFKKKKDKCTKKFGPAGDAHGSCIDEASKYI